MKFRNMETTQSPRIIISGGGTGGHIFPAISIANAFKKFCPHAEILFVGAEGRMEMKRVPDAGYSIVGLPISGFDRQRIWRNFLVLVKIVRSQWKARQIIKRFKPRAVVGVGGYASGPTLKMAGMMGIPTLIQEQNSYAGVTNKLLARKASKICVAYEGMERFFPAEKIVMTGNPVRQNLLDNIVSRDEAASFFRLNPAKKTLLILGGSLGAGTLNRTLCDNLETIRTHSDIQFIWQTGKVYLQSVKESIVAFTGEPVEDSCVPSLPNLFVTDFIKEMRMAYSLADLVISRAGAGSISEFCLLGKSVILVPSPNVAEDHQTKNALALVKKGAALYVKDVEAAERLLPVALESLADDAKLERIRTKIAKLAIPDSADLIAQEVLKLIEESEKS